MKKNFVQTKEGNSTTTVLSEVIPGSCVTEARVNEASKI